MRKALIVGIDKYEHKQFGCLGGCVGDALAVRDVLERHSDGGPNFVDPQMLLATTDPDHIVTRQQLRRAVQDLFTGSADIALFYFAGHGHADTAGGFLATSECETGDDGLSMAELMRFQNQSPATNRIVILDCCHSGGMADHRVDPEFAEIRKGTTILTASRSDQFAAEGAEGGLFTGLLIDALHGEAANLLGDISPGSVYAHIDQSLGRKGQRPMFKTNIEWFVSLRRVAPPVPLTDLTALPAYFPDPRKPMPLDPRYEPERTLDQNNDPSIPPPDPKLTAIFAALQRCVRVNLVRPVGADHMWHAAMHYQACELTPLGRHYHGLAATGRI